MVFYQVGLDEESSKKTTLWTPFGGYRYLRMPLGISVAPEEFECKLQEKLTGLEGVEILRDDLLVVGYGDTQEKADANHDENLRKLLDRAEEVKLKLNSMEMNLKKPQVKSMGHVVSKDGLKPDPIKVKAVENMSKPTCKKETLSLLEDTGPEDEEFQVFALGLEAMNPFDTIKISRERLPQLQKATEQDPVMQTLKTTILIGWPERREEVPVQIREFWNYREELTLHNGILFKNQRVIIPKALRSELTTRAHSSHQGIEACIRRAKDEVFWPSMTKDIKEAVEKCETCAAFQAKNDKQAMQTHEIPNRPWSRVSSDLFTLNCKEYIVLADSYSDFIEVGEVKVQPRTTS